MRSHDDFRDALGAFALDAVTGEERRELERHIDGCAECRAEIDEHLRTAATLAEEVNPPRAVWEGIEAAVRAEPAPGRVVRIDRPVERRRPVGRVAAALAAAALALVGVLSWRVVDLDRQLDRRSDGLTAVAAEAFASPDGVRVTLGDAQGDVRVPAVVLPDGTAYLRAGDLPRLSEERTYQLWAVTGDRVVSAGVLGRAPGIVAFSVGPGTVALAITEEVAGGVVESENEPVVAGEIA